MYSIRNFKLLDNLNGYNKATNPKKLNIYELLPYGVTWSYHDKEYEIIRMGKVIPILLRDHDGIALIESPFNEKDNKAYILTPSNKIKWDVKDIINKRNGNVIFSDVYYIGNDLYFFVHVNNNDYRFIFYPQTGKVGDLILSY